MKIDRNSYGTLAIVYIVSLSIIAAMTFVACPWVKWPVIAIFVWFIGWQTYFFRVPRRNAAGSDKLVSSVADGKVVIIDKVFEPGWAGIVNAMKVLVRRGKEANDQINILGDDGVPVSYHEQYWKSELIDFVILQQDAFDKIDAITPMDRQEFMLTLVLDICDHKFNFESFEECAAKYKEIINIMRQMNYSEYNGSAFNKYLGQVKSILSNEQ